MDKKLKKTLCKLKKSDIENFRAEIEEEVSSPIYICKRCARVARTQKRLCKPDSLSQSKEK